jgi:hypothetical protein
METVIFPSPREAVGRVDRLSGAKEIGVGGYFESAQELPPTPDPSPPLRCASRGEGR